MAVSMAIGLTAAAVTASAVASLRLARADTERDRAEYALDGAEVVAIVALLQSPLEQRYAWTANEGGESFAVLAEPEAAKLSYAAAAALGDGDLARLAASPAQARRRLADLASVTPIAPAAKVRLVDVGAVWRACARSLISPLGRGGALSLAAPIPPAAGALNWRVGAVWRIRVANSRGWVEDRLVRFTGDGRHPAAVVERDVYRTSEKAGACDGFVDPRPPV